jgi:hypothetical protein
MSDAARAVTCPSCGGTVQVRAAGFSVTLVCEYCGSVLDVANPDVALIEKHKRAAAQLAMPLGSRGSVLGNEYQVVGFMRRSIEGEGWDEYLLFNPYVGYRWLVEEDGEWSFGTMLLSLPDVDSLPAVRVGAVAFRNEDQEYIATVDNVVGEFYWRVKVDDAVELMNFEGAAATLSREAQNDEVNWTVSNPLRRSDVRGFKGETFDTRITRRVHGRRGRTRSPHRRYALVNPQDRLGDGGLPDPHHGNRELRRDAREQLSVCGDARWPVAIGHIRSAGLFRRAAESRNQHDKQ